jgi:AraC-like DNA-binding protein
VSEPIKTAWLDRLIFDVQELSLTVVITETNDLSAVVHEFSARVQPAPDPLHNALLANAMLDVCRHIFDSLHAALPYDGCSCAGEMWRLAMRFTRWYETDPRALVCEWVDEFLPVYRRNHPPSAGTRAGELVRRDPARPWTLVGLARRLGVNRRKLSIDFRNRFGLGVPAYLSMARVTRALSSLEPVTKLEAISLEVGFRSKKDFYRAFRKWTGQTPATVRALPVDVRRVLQASLNAKCLWGDRYGSDTKGPTAPLLTPIQANSQLQDRKVG